MVGNELEKRRKLPMALLSIKSTFLGYVETLGGPLGSVFKYNFFKLLGLLGIAKYEFYQNGKLKNID